MISRRAYLYPHPGRFQMKHEAMAQQVDSLTIFGPNQFVTGVRGWSGSDVVLTGNSASDGPTTALIYIGPLTATDSGPLYLNPPVFDGQTVTSSTFYGP